MNFTEIFNYSTNLQLNNNRTWFHENHVEYDNARKSFLGFLDLFRFEVNKEFPDFGKTIMYMEPKEWMYRIARDMRYHKNGPPYNPAFRAYIAPDRKSWLPVGYFLRLYPDSSCFGTGLWCESTAKMNGIRRYISENYEEFKSIIDRKHIAVTGDTLKSMPRGFSADDPAAKYVKMKNWTVMVHIPNEDIVDFESFAALLVLYVGLMEPMRQFLLRAAKAAETDNKRPKFEW